MNRLDRKPILFLILMSVPVSATGLYFIFRSKDLPPKAGDPMFVNRRSESVVVGGVRRSVAEVTPGPRALELSKRRSAPGAGNAKQDLSSHPIGISPAYSGNENVSAKFVADAVRNRTNPERITPMIMPPAFDLAAYQADPKAYTDLVEPGRIWQAMQPGPDVPSIKRLAKRNPTIKQGESIRLSVKTAPNAPVTFTSFDLGAFENLTGSITVVADDSGLASASFTGTRGTFGDSNVVAASPLSSGQVHFIVNILPRGQ